LSQLSSRERQLSTVRLVVTAGSPLAEIFIIDQDFALVDRSVGDFNAELPAGVYKVKAKLADAATERLILLQDDATLDISRDLIVRSAVPLAEASTNRPLDSLQVPEDRGASRVDNRAEILMMTRSDTIAGDTSARPPRISLLSTDGKRIASLEPNSLGLDHQSSTIIQVDPGPYFARREDRFGDAAEQCLYALNGWQTQLFTSEEPGEEDEIGRIRVSVLMSRDGFDPSDPELHTVEEARTALAEERKIATAELGQLCETTENPMLALFGAHLMLIARDTELRESEQRETGRLDRDAVTAPVQFDQTSFDRIVDRLSVALGPEHADVVALATQRTNQSLDALHPISAPPMLWRSWILLIAASNEVPRLVPIHTWQRTLHVLPLRPFFLWAPVDEPRINDSLKQSIVTSISANARAAHSPHGPTAPSLAWPQEPAKSDDEDRRRLSAQLLVPRAAIDELASGGSL